MRRTCCLGISALAIGLAFFPVQTLAMPASNTLLTAGNGAHSLKTHVLKTHGDHCTFRRGHRHSWACKSRSRRYREESHYRRFGGIEIKRRDGRGDYPDYPRWADRVFTEANDRGSP